MSYQLRSDEIMEALQISEHPRAAVLILRIERAVTEAANELAAHLGVDCGHGTFEGLAFAGLCVPFHPAYDGQELPEALKGFDNEEEWV